MGFAGFVTSGLVPAVGGALRGRNAASQRAEEQRRYNTEQMQQASEVKWRQQQALEAAQRQAMMDALAQQAQGIAAKGGAEGRALQVRGMEQQARESEANRQNALRIAELGAKSREVVAGIGAQGKIDAKMAGGGTGAGDPSPGQETDLAEYDASLQDISAARGAVLGNAAAFSLGKQAVSNVPFFNQLGRNLVDRSDPGGVRARAAVGVIQSTIRRLQSGTAVTKSEKEVLESFLPDPRSDSDEVILQKLDGLEQWIAAKRTALESRSGAGTAQAPRPTATPAASPPKATSARERAVQLREQGVGREEAMQILREEGWNVQ